jgi:signal transduction histidine kinase
LTLLTVSAVGILALSLIKRYVEGQEQEYLTANAEVVARQAAPLMAPAAHRLGLRELVHTASFLGNARVRILDDHRQVLADSGSHSEGHEFVWIVPPTGLSIRTSSTSLGVSIMVLPTDLRSAGGIAHDEPFGILEQLPPGTEFSLARRVEGPRGTRFIFGPRQELEMVPAFPMDSDAASLLESLAEEARPRSKRRITVPIGGGNELLGYVELSRGPDFAADALATARRALLLAAGGATMLALVVGLLVSRGLTAPLGNLTTAASQMSGGDLSIRAPVRGKDEIGQLARQFNQMAEQLEASFAQMAGERDNLRRFIADASHELRTPITALRNFNELLQGAAVEDPEARDEFLSESQVQLDRLEWITHNLLDLSRIEAGLVPLDTASHDVGELIEVTASTFKALAHEKDVTLEVNPPSLPLEIFCDRARIELALSNLLDNGLKFTPAGGRVAIGAEQAAQNVQIWVRDTGPGIAPADLPHIFERFYRGQGSLATGSGLGLAIVRSIIQAHGGGIAVESEPGKGSRFVVELPLTGHDEESP